MKRIVERSFFGSLLVLCLLASFTIGASHGVAGPRLNLTPSVPRGLYLYVPGAVKRGELVQACLPHDLAMYARDRGILLSGLCPSGVEPLVKILAAVPGDVITVSNDGLQVNGRPWPSSVIRSIDSSGHRVDMRLPSGTQRLLANHVLLLGLHPSSWDGRYFGALPSSVISGRWLPLITERTTK
jgi:conjugative transfer signal peptidase TraF